MKRVPLAKIEGCAPAEIRGSQTGEVVLPGELREERRRCVLDMGVVGKVTSAFGDVDGPQLAGPLINIAEKIAVDRLQVREVESSFQRRQRKLVRTGRHTGGLSLFESGLVRKAEPIS